jgi:quercetin dioxygenase-like cupin family protein
MVRGIAHPAGGETFARHRHPEAEVCCGPEGEGTVMVGAKPHRVAPGVAIFIPGGVEHAVVMAAQAFGRLRVFAADRFEDIAPTFTAGAARPA